MIGKYVMLFSLAVLRIDSSILNLRCYCFVHILIKTHKIITNVFFVSFIIPWFILNIWVKSWPHIGLLWNARCILMWQAYRYGGVHIDFEKVLSREQHKVQSQFGMVAGHKHLLSWHQSINHHRGGAIEAQLRSRIWWGHSCALHQAAGSLALWGQFWI